MRREQVREGDAASRRLCELGEHLVDARLLEPPTNHGLLSAVTHRHTHETAIGQSHVRQLEQGGERDSCGRSLQAQGAQALYSSAVFAPGGVIAGPRVEVTQDGDAVCDDVRMDEVLLADALEDALDAVPIGPEERGGELAVGSAMGKAVAAVERGRLWRTEDLQRAPRRSLDDLRSRL
jgi:hypothetical protein